MGKSDDGTAITSSYSGEALSFVEETVDIMIHAAEEYLEAPESAPYSYDHADAVSRLDEPNSYGESWSAEKILSVLRDYARSDSVRVADPDTIVGDGRPSLVELADGRGYSFEHDVPFSGEWSDLIAQFEFLHRPSGYAVVLHDIHVL